MVWKANAPQGAEAFKIRFDLIPYCGGSVLDLGCGPSKVFAHAVGVDNYTETRLFGIQMKPDVEVETCERLPQFADASWDCVFSSHLLEHIVDFKAALQEWWRLVKPGGTLVLYLPHKAFYPNIGQEGANPDHKHDFYPSDIVLAMVEACADWDLELNQERNKYLEYSFLQVFRKKPAGSGVSYSYKDQPSAKRCAVVRLGAYGDALWASSILPHLKAEGYHVTVFTQRQGLEVLRHDPHVDAFVDVQDRLFQHMPLLGYWVWLEENFDRVINLTGSVETRLLPAHNDNEFYWPDSTRRALMSQANYLADIHTMAGVPHVWCQKFYATAGEQIDAAALRATLPLNAEQRLAGYELAPLVVVAPTGSSVAKCWPHVQEFMERMADAGVHTVVVGELRGPTGRDELKLSPVVRNGITYGHVWGVSKPIRQVMALAQIADAVVGTESAVVNAVAFEPMLKVVLLSHSTHANLTKHWNATVHFAAEGLKCYPCHRIHSDLSFCTRHPQTRGAMCQALATADVIAGEVLQYLGWRLSNSEPPAERAVQASELKQAA
jgi:ADP-heptose:LPS heptosyltransferase/predicted SAM-dependent methyltransferase